MEREDDGSRGDHVAGAGGNVRTEAVKDRVGEKNMYVDAVMMTLCKPHTGWAGGGLRGKED